MHRKIVGNQVNNENRSSISGCCRPCPGKILNSFTNTKLKLLKSTFFEINLGGRDPEAQKLPQSS
jgi:hypothetical protein